MEPVLNLRKPKLDADAIDIPLKKKASDLPALKSDVPVVVQWGIPSTHTHYNKKRVFLAAIILFVAALLLIVISGEYLFGIFIALCGTLIFIFDARAVPMRSVFIDGGGIKINHDRYLYRDLKSFWIAYEPRGIQQVSIEFRKWNMPIVRIPIHQVAPLAIRDILIQYLPERPHTPSLTDIILKRMGL